MSAVRFERREFSGGAAQAHITSTLDAGATTIPIDNATGWGDGSGGRYYVTINRGGSTEERIIVQSRSGLVLSLTDATDRGVDGSTAQSHAVGETIEITNSATDDDEANQAAVATLGAVRARGDVLVGTTGFTLARKPVGIDGSFFVATSSDAAGVSWSQIPDGAISSNTMFSAGVVDGAAIAASAIGASQLASPLAPVIVQDATPSIINGALWLRPGASGPPIRPDIWSYCDGVAWQWLSAGRDVYATASSTSTAAVADDGVGHTVGGFAAEDDPLGLVAATSITVPAWAPTARWSFTAEASLDTTADTTVSTKYLQLVLYVNASAVAAFQGPQAPGVVTQISVAGAKKCVAGDVITMKLLQHMGASRNLFGFHRLAATMGGRG